MISFIANLINSRNRCPKCNSTPPELIGCPICHGYHKDNGDPWPPHPDLVRKWRERFEEYKLKNLSK